MPFGIEYDGFAERSVYGVTGYLPRKCTPREELKGSNLLTELEVQYLFQQNDDLAFSSGNKVFTLTGSSNNPCNK